MINYKLANGLYIPAIGFGTYKSDTESLSMAIKAGYRYFDTASVYKTEENVAWAIKDSGILRDEFYIATKAWKDEMGYKEVKQACERSLKKLETDYIDLYMIHWPKPSHDYTDWKRLGTETWKAMEDLYKEGKVRAVGLSNFLPHHIDNILQSCEIKPMINQLEIHPGYSQEYACGYCERNNILLAAWSPLGRQRVLNHPLLESMAIKYNVTVAQICIRFCVQRKIIPLPKSSSKERMMNNTDVFSFELEKEDMYILMTLPQYGWSGEHPDFERVKI